MFSYKLFVKIMTHRVKMKTKRRLLVLFWVWLISVVKFSTFFDPLTVCLKCSSMFF
jgi:hypothetical protein